jgi:hypothetical protein
MEKGALAKTWRIFLKDSFLQWGRYVALILSWSDDQSMDNFRRGLHSFFVTGPKMYQLYQTSFKVCAQ